MDYWTHSTNIQKRQDLLLTSLGKQGLKEGWLRFFKFFRQRNGGLHIRKGIVGRAVVDVICRREIFQPKTWQIIIPRRPAQSFRAQRIKSANHVNKVPPGSALAILPGVSWKEISIKRESRHLIIESYRVIAQGTGARLLQFLMNVGDKIHLTQTLLHRRGRADPRHSRGCRVR